jgi:hypothetical protein
MHPIERLRYVARIGADRPDLVAREAALALLPGCDRPAELVVACRRLLDRHPAAGPLWWVASVALTAAHAFAALDDALDRLEGDPTERHLAEALGAAGPGDVATVDAWAIGPSGILTASPEAVGARGLRTAGVRVWAVGGVGRVLPARAWEAALARLDARPQQAVGVLDAGDIDAVVGPFGLQSFEVAAGAADFAVAPELLSVGP